MSKVPWRASEESEPSLLWRWKVEAKDKQPILCPELLFSFHFSRCPVFLCSLCVCVHVFVLSGSATGVGPRHKWNPFMINEVAIVMTFPPLLQWDGGRGILQEKLHSQHYPPSVIHWGVALITSQILRMDLVNFFIPNTFQAGEGKGRGWAGRHFQPDSVSVCLYESKVWVSSSATFYGKVSFPPLCLQRLPDTDRVCRLLCGGEQTLLVSEAAGLHRKRESSDCVGAFKVKTGSSSSVQLLFWMVLFFPSCGVLLCCFWFWVWRCLASGDSGSGEIRAACHGLCLLLARGQERCCGEVSNVFDLLLLQSTLRCFR